MVEISAGSSLELCTVMEEGNCFLCVDEFPDFFCTSRGSI